MTWRRYALILPLPFMLWEPANTLMESWWHYGFSVRYGPFKVQLVRPAKERVAELMVDNTPVEKGDTIAGFAVTSGFGPRTSPCPGCSANHGGVDLATPVGTPLFAPNAIEVTCFWDTGGGGLVADLWLQGENYKALHLETCEAGSYAPGEVFAKTGNTGNGTGPHLDWRKRMNGAWVKPTKGILAATLSGRPLVSSGAIDIDALRQAIIGHESGGNFSAVNPDSGALGYGQVMPANVASWTRSALGYSLSPAQFLADPEAQLATINHKLNEYVQQQLEAGHSEELAVRRVASAWYSGQAGLYDDTQPQPYGNTVYESIQSYTLGVLSKYQKLR